MKTFQRILAVILALVMSLSVIGVAAFATEVTAPDTITESTGNLTIHKYEYNGNPGNNGTGSSTDSVPDGATALGGVTFKITKIADLTDYYGPTEYTLPTIAQAQAIVAANDEKDDDDSTKLFTTTGVTASTGDTKGQVTFSNLSLGLYLVQETDAPAQITGKTPDFLVSIPMTTTDGADWLYDVHVFPKNSSTYAGVTLLKQGKVGIADPSALSGATFVLQLKGTDNKWTTVTENNKGVAIGENGTLTTDADGKISVSDLAPGEYRFVETSVGNGYIMDGATTYNFTINDAGKVLIDNHETDTTQNPITVINEKPDMDKQVKEGNTYQEAADYSVGDNVEYKVTIEVPSNINKLTTFTLTDTLTNQKFNDDVAIAELENVADAYTVSTEGTNKFTITFDTSKLTAGQTLTITYTAELLSSAVTTNVGNPNSAVLTYDSEILPNSNEDGNPNEPGDPSENTITDQTVVYTFELKVDKDDENGNPLEGVKFDVYSYSGTESNPTEAELKTNGKVVAQITTNAQGAATVTGLENGTYYLVETETVDGYNLLKAPVAVTLNVSYKTTWNESNTYDEDGNLIKHDVTKKEEYFGGSASAVGASYVTQTIVNKKGFTLPQTGGIGTLMFILMGGVLIAGGICLIAVPNKKRSV